ncbi:MAG: restriction endonuclease subunit S [Spiribacter salinus]|uniref:Restriction endonuclease subunit S n=1 Tax=Spiribacter salinus TaxID=1335746 RepID=A0A540VS20_9GAMM|nr:MAG: restriction endonuclease subunit S [Spiribacter salinus]
MSWQELQLGEAFRIKHGYAFKSQYFGEAGKHVVLTPGNFQEAGGFRSRPGKDRFYTVEPPEDFILKPDDLVVAMTEQGEGLLGSSAMIPVEGSYLHNQRIGLIEDLDESKLDKGFLYRLFNTSQVRAQIRATASGTKVRHTAPKRIYAVRVRAPSIAEQRRISEVLSNHDDLIENNRRRIALLEEAARLLYREWFVHLRFPGHEHARVTDGLPEGWERVRLSDKFDTASGGTPSRQRSEFFEGEINWVKTQELDERPVFSTAEKITEEAVRCSSAKLLPAHTLLVSIYGNTNIGRTGILAVPGATNQACVALFPKRKPDDWIYAQLWLQQHRDYIVGLAQGAAQTNISQQTLRGLELLWPKDILLDAFLDVVLDQYRQMECLCLQNEKLTQARDLLLPRLMNGEIAV